MARSKVENSGDVRASEAPRPVPVSPATFHVDIFSSVVCLQTLTKPENSNSSHVFFFYCTMTAIQLSKLL